jgi:hypothetical protein
MAAADGWKQKGQKVKDINTLSIPKYTINVDISHEISGFYPDLSSMQFHNFLAMRQSDTGSLILTAVMQSLEDDENLFILLVINANPVVCYGKEPFLFLAFG